LKHEQRHGFPATILWILAALATVMLPPGSVRALRKRS
jgi:hypothetical protein